MPIPEPVAMVLFILFFGGLGLGALTFGLSALVGAPIGAAREMGRDDAVGLAAGGAVFAAVAAVAAHALVGSRREDQLSKTVAPLPSAAAVSTTGLRAPWPVPVVAAVLAERLHDWPDTIEASEGAIVIRTDIASARYRFLLTQHAIAESRTVTLTRVEDGLFARKDVSNRGVGQLGPTGLSGERARSSGRSWSLRRQISLGTDGGQMHRAVDVDYSTKALDAVLREVLTEAGWRTRLGANARGGVIVGVTTLALLATAGAVIGVLHLMGATVG